MASKMKYILSEALEQEEFFVKMMSVIIIATINWK